MHREVNTGRITYSCFRSQDKCEAVGYCSGPDLMAPSRLPVSPTRGGIRRAGEVTCCSGSGDGRKGELGIQPRRGRSISLLFLFFLFHRVTAESPRFFITRLRVAGSQNKLMILRCQKSNNKGFSQKEMLGVWEKGPRPNSF